MQARTPNGDKSVRAPVRAGTGLRFALGRRVSLVAWNLRDGARRPIKLNNQS